MMVVVKIRIAFWIINLYASVCGSLIQSLYAPAFNIPELNKCQVV